MAAATTMFLRDMGLWLAPTAEVFAYGRGEFAGTAAVGVGNRDRLASVFFLLLFREPLPILSVG